MAPNALVYIAVAAFVPIVFGCFAVFPPRRAVLLSLLGGWLFLPTFDRFGRSIPLLHSKAAYVPVIVLTAAIVFDRGVWRRVRMQAIDFPMIAFVVLPFFTALNNGLGFYEAGSAFVDSVAVWGTPYLLGRAYFGGYRGQRRLAIGIVAGALVYVPLCLFEVRMSPQLHSMVYGFRTFVFGQTVRFGGYRPSVFLAHGLMLAMLMAGATLLAFWLWRTRTVRRIWGIPISSVVIVLFAVTLLCKSTGAIVLLACGAIVLEASTRFRTRALVCALCMIPPAYCVTRISGWSGDVLVSTAARYIDPERAESLAFRMENENLLIAKALQRPVIGWGRWGRARVHDESGRDIVVTDSFWVIVFGATGVLGLTSIAAALSSPALLLVRQTKVRAWRVPRCAPTAALAVLVSLWVIDCLLNAMVAPVYPTAAGAVVSTLALRGRGARDAIRQRSSGWNDAPTILGRRSTEVSP